jgi:dienelactone hydrolase
MAEVLLYHHAQGQTPGFLAFAEELRAAGHTVHTPDLFDGEVFDDIDEGMRKEETLGYREIARRAKETVAGLPAGLVFAGFSMGSANAELLAASRPGASGAVLMHGAAPVEALSEFFGVERWPAGVPVQVHYAADDPWVDAEEEVTPLGRDVRGAGAAFEEYVYPGSGHLFADPDVPEYDRAPSEEMWERVLAFLDRRPRGARRRWNLLAGPAAGRLGHCSCTRKPYVVDSTGRSGHRSGDEPIIRTS